jgi:hypothetical protein
MAVSRNDAFVRRKSETARYYRDRREGRQAIFEKFAYTLDAIWKPQPRPASLGPDRSEIARQVQLASQRHKNFETREQSLLGRLANAARLAGQGASLTRHLRLAVDAKERRRVFERQQDALDDRMRRTTRSATQAEKSSRPQETRKARSDRAKAMRTAELAAWDRETRLGGTAIKAAHSEQIAAEAQTRRDLMKEARTAWSRHNATYNNVQRASRTPGQRPSPPRDAPENAPGGPTDAFGQASPPPSRSERDHGWKKSELAAYRRHTSRPAGNTKSRGPNEDDGRSR